MSFGATIRQRRHELNIGLNEFAERLGISPTYWSRIERAAAILGVRMDDLFVEAQRLPPDMRENMAKVVVAYRRMRTNYRR